jgi:hypothetical protein
MAKRRPAIPFNTLHGCALVAVTELNLLGYMPRWDFCGGEVTWTEQWSFTPRQSSIAVILFNQGI